MKKIAVIGGSGMVASRFCDLVKDRFDVVSLDEKTLDITDNSLVGKYFASNKFDAVINFAAYTNVDAAEAEKGNEEGLTYKLNVLGPKNLAEYCNENNIFLVHISTDFVFPGIEAMSGPYDEDSLLPETSEGIGWYGWTKNRAEYIIKNISESFAIIRYGYPFRASTYEKKNDWARNLINLYNEHKLYPLFEDQIHSVLFIDDLIEPLVKIIDQNLYGIFHIASVDTTTPYEIGLYLLEKYTGNPVELKKGSMAEFLKAEGRTPRPRLGGLKVEKTEKKLGMKFKTWREMVDEFIKQLKTNS
jgi:dTDP-4-dehydrorhamnose reductase